MGETIRDVVIRIAIENGENRFQLSDFKSASEMAREYERNVLGTFSVIERVSAESSSYAASQFTSAVEQMQNRVGAFRDDLGSAFTQSGRFKINRPDPVSAIDIQNSEQSATSSVSSHPGVEEMRQQFKSVREQMDEVKKSASTGSDSTGMLSQGFMSANLSAGVLTLGVAALAAGLKAYSVVANETRDTTQEYWSDMAADSLSSGRRTFGRITRETANDAERRRVLSTDLTGVQNASVLSVQWREREDRIQQMQKPYANHPLSVRQEIRSRIEGQGQTQDELFKSQATMDHLNDRLSRVDQDEAAINDRLDRARKEYEGTMRGIQSAKDAVQATRSGNLAGDYNRLFGDGTLGPASESSFNYLGQMWDHSVAGETTLFDKFQHDKQMGVQADKATSAFEKVESQSAVDLRKLDEERLSINRDLSAEAGRRLGIIREEQRESRESVEAGREDLLNKKLRLGRADEATKASLRQIQAKADQGIELNPMEGGLAEQYGIDAAQKYRQQALKSAELPENAGMLSEATKLQQGREGRLQDATSPKVQDEATKLEDMLESKGDEAANIIKSITARLEKESGFIELLQTLDHRITENEAALERLKRKNRYF